MRKGLALLERGLYFCSMKFKEGDKVSFLNQVGYGTVLKYVDGGVLVEDENGFEDLYEERELVIRGNFAVEGIQRKDETRPRREDEGKNRPGLLEKDLHFNKLVDFPKNFSNYEMLQIQLREARQFLDRARVSGNKRIVLIHGVGDGRLKEEIHSMLERMDNLRFYDASYAEYGQGATEVELY